MEGIASVSERRARHRKHLAEACAEPRCGKGDDAPRCAVVSGCLLGSPCRYDGGSKPNAAVAALVASLRDAGWRIRRICPEAAGRLPRPRPPAEIQPDGRVLDSDGVDVTGPFERGAAHACAVARRTRAELAIVKANSPSCGCYEVYDGSFSGVLVPGMGIAARRLEGEGVLVVDERDVEWLAGEGCADGDCRSVDMTSISKANNIAKP